MGDADDAEPDDQRGGDRRDHADKAVEAGLEARDVYADAHALGAAHVHALALEALRARRLDHGHGGERLAGERGDLALVRALGTRPLAHAHAIAVAEQPQCRHRQEGDEREDGVDREGHDRHADQQQRALRNGPERLGEEIPDRGDVLGHARDEVALLGSLVIVERQTVEVLVDRDAQRVRDALARAVEPQVGEVVRDRLGERDDHDERDDDQQQPRVARAQVERSGL